MLLNPGGPFTLSLASSPPNDDVNPTPLAALLHCSGIHGTPRTIGPVSTNKTTINSINIIHNNNTKQLTTLLSLCSTHCSPVNAILPNSRTLDGYPLRQNWSATLYNNIIMTTIIIIYGSWDRVY